MNIVWIVSVAGLPPEKLVEAHGTFASATCTICGSKKPESEVKVSRNLISYYSVVMEMINCQHTVFDIQNSLN